jgi:hypothetical protein
VQELSAYPLKLETDGQLAPVKVDVIPGEPEDLTFA